MYLIIKYFKEDLAQLALLNGNVLPPTPQPYLWLENHAGFL